MEIYIGPKIVKDEVSKMPVTCNEPEWKVFFNCLKLPFYFLNGSPDDSHVYTKSSKFLIPGGNDLFSLNKNSENRVRQEIDESIIKLVVENNFSLLGICKGAQSIFNYYSGQVATIENHAGTKHRIDWQNEISGLKNIKEVTSHHDYGLSTKEVPQEIEILATDGTNWIEAFRVKGKPIYGLMWHPERQSNAEDYLEFFRSF